MSKLIARITSYMSFTYIPYSDTLLDPNPKVLHLWLLGFYFGCEANTTSILRVINSHVESWTFLLEKLKSSEGLLQPSLLCK